MSTPAAKSQADIFLAVQTKRAGKLKGESKTEPHVDEIEVRAWQWGGKTSSALATGLATSRRQYEQLVVVKGIDSASTGLLSAMATNDEVKEARLSVRKGGGDTLDYLTIVLNGARIVEVHMSVDETGHAEETVTIGFTQVEVTYKSQKDAGGSGGNFVFQDEFLDPSVG